MTTVPLTRTIAHGPQIFACLKFRRPALGDMQLVNALAATNDFDYAVKLIARLCNIPIEVAEKIDADDLVPVVAALGEILNGIPTDMSAPPKPTLH